MSDQKPNSIFNSDIDLEAAVSSEVDNFKEKNQQKFQHFTPDKSELFNCGAFGMAFLLESNDSNQKYVQKIPHKVNNNANSLENEAKITDKIGTEGAKKRALRRAKKGYDLDIRLSAPQVFSAEKKFYMEYIGKGDLARLHNSLDVYDLFKQVGKLVTDLHSSGYIHRDIKPDNLLLDYDDKIRLCDMDSVIEVKNYNPLDLYCTLTYSDFPKLSEPSANRYKIDIYSTAVTLLSYSLGYYTFKDRIQQICPNSSRPYQSSRTLKRMYINFAKGLADRELGDIIGNMLNGSYNSMNDVLDDLSKIKTVIDKKRLKIALSYIFNGNSYNKIVKLLSKRNEVLDSMDNFPFFNFLVKGKLHKINQEIGDCLLKCSKKLAPQEEAHIKKLADDFLNNNFTQNHIIITTKSIKKQQKKNIAKENINKGNHSIPFTKNIREMKALSDRYGLIDIKEKFASEHKFSFNSLRNKIIGGTNARSLYDNLRPINDINMDNNKKFEK